MTDRLFLINPDWRDDLGGPWFCPAGAFVEGVLAFYPALTDQLEITRLDFPRPRPPVIDLVGEDHQSCPILVLDGDFDWPDANGPRAKIDEELAELDRETDNARREEELGDLLFAVVNLARHFNIDPEEALRKANRKFEKRFRAIEQAPGFGGMSLDEKEDLWSRVKASQSD